jgi:hypothetical protein
MAFMIDKEVQAHLEEKKKQDDRAKEFCGKIDALCSEYGFVLKVKIEVVREGVILADPIWIPTR